MTKYIIRLSSFPAVESKDNGTPTVESIVGSRDKSSLLQKIGKFCDEVMEGAWLDKTYTGKVGPMGNKREPIKMPIAPKESAETVSTKVV